MITEVQNSGTNIAPTTTSGSVASTPNSQVRFRCPHCQKLYQTGTDVFEGSAPEFDCSSCSKTFTLTTQQDAFGLYNTSFEKQAVFSTCPKCSGLKPQKSDECPSCGVLASKYIALQKVESPALFELNQCWQKVMNHFDDDQYHQDFLNKCHMKMALNFAFQKYSELQKTLGFDQLCEKYIRQIELRMEQQFRTPQETKINSQNLKSRIEISTLQWLFFSVGTVGMLSLIYNKFIPTFPNFNGFVLTLTLLSFGAGIFSNNPASKDIKF
jgi:hypothetical protein